MDTATDPVVEAANVAVAILDAFDTVPVPPLLDFKPAVRIGLHAGNRMKQYLKFLSFILELKSLQYLLHVRYSL